MSFLFFTAFTFDGFAQLGVFSNNAPNTGNAIIEINSDANMNFQDIPELRLNRMIGIWNNFNLFSWDIALGRNSTTLDFIPTTWGGRGLPTLSLSADGDLTVQRSLKTQSISGSDNRGVFVINNPATYTSFPAIEMYNNNSTSRKGNINFVSDATNGSEGAFNFVRYTAQNAWTNSMEIDGGGNVTVYGEFVIRNTDLSKQFKVDRTGAVRARRVQVDLATIPDYVFKPDYKLMPLDDLKTFIAKNNHLPNVPSEQEYKERGNIDLSELNLKLLEKGGGTDALCVAASR